MFSPPNILTLWYDDEAQRTQIHWQTGYVHPECLNELNSDRVHTNTFGLHLHLHLGPLADGFIQRNIQ